MNRFVLAILVMALLGLVPLCYSAGARPSRAVPVAPAGPSSVVRTIEVGIQTGRRAHDNIVTSLSHAVKAFNHPQFDGSQPWKWAQFKDLFETAMMINNYGSISELVPGSPEYDDTARFYLGMMSALFAGSALFLVTTYRAVLHTNSKCQMT